MENGVAAFTAFVAAAADATSAAVAAAVAAVIETLRALAGAAGVTALSEPLFAAGPFAVSLLILTALAALITLAKLAQFAFVGVGRRRDSRAALRQWRRGQPQKVLKALGRRRDPAARALTAAMRGMLQTRLREQQVQMEARRELASALFRLRSYLVVLKVIALCAPLLGALGALPPAHAPPLPPRLTTLALALYLSLGCVLAYYWLSRRVDRCERFADDLLLRLFARTPLERRRAAGGPS